MADIPVFFYIPPSEWPENGIPETPIADWRAKDLWPLGKNIGIYSLTIQTYLRLKSNNFPCEIIDSIPDQGILIAHRDVLPNDPRLLNKNLLVVCIKAERTPHPFASLHVVQNPIEKKELSPCWNPFYIPHWAQRDLIKRDENRGDKFENIAYFGRKVNMAPELKSSTWVEQIEQLGLNWVPVTEDEHWSNYSHVDAILAVRSFDRQTYDAKPATKLFNAWRAGVPAIVGNDSAFSAEQRSDLDFIQVTTVEDAIEAMKQLRDNAQLRKAMAENGFRRAKEIEFEMITKIWENFVSNHAMPAYENQRKRSDFRHKLNFGRRCTNVLMRRLRS